MRRHRSRSVPLMAVALTLGIAGCGSAGGSGGAERVPGATSNRIVRAELSELGQLSGLEAVQRLRPRWLRARGGGTPVLYVDGARRGTTRDLDAISSTEIEQMEYMSSADASNRFGTGHQGGAVLVSTRR